MMKRLFQTMTRCLWILFTGIFLYSLVPSVAAGAPPGCITPPVGLVGWWPLDEVGGTDINDKAGPCNLGTSMYNNNGSPILAGVGATNGPISVQGEVMGALQFGGNVMYVQVPDSPALNFSGGDFSIDAWIKPNTDPNFGCNLAGRHVTPIVDKWDATGTGKGYRFFIEQGTAFPGRGLHFVIGDGSNLVRAYAPINISTCCNGWVHVTAVYRAGSPDDIIELFVDGNPVITTIVYNFGAPSTNPLFPHVNSLDNPPQDLLIGRIDPLPSAYTDAGLCEMPVDEIEIFDRALPPTDIVSIFNAGPYGKCKQRVSIPATRQRRCYNAAGAPTLCQNLLPTTQDGEVQGGVAWPSVRFVDHVINTIPFIDIAQDMLTGLQWPKDAGTPTVSGCTPSVLLPGCSPLGQCTGGAKTWQQALYYVDCLNSVSYLGMHDWRLPNINELDFVHAALNITSYLPGWLSTNTNAMGFSNVQNNYWSSTTSAGNPNYKWSMGISTGIVDYDPKTDLYHVWPVRVGPRPDPDPAYPANTWVTGQTAMDSPGDDGNLQWGVRWPSPRFSDACTSPPGCAVSDDLTGLIWAKDASTPLCGGLSGKMIWQDAFTYVQCLNAISYCSQNDWRVPNINELHSLVDHSRFNPALAYSFNNVQPDHYWSSTAHAGIGSGTASLQAPPGDAWSVDFVGGGVYYGDRLPGLYVLPVRGGSGGSLCVPVYAGTNVQIHPVTNVTVTFPSVDHSGLLCAQAIPPTCNSNPNFVANGNIAYQITFNSPAAFTGNAEVCIDSPFSMAGGATIQHYSGGGCSGASTLPLSFPPQQIFPAPSVHRICALTTSFSEFTVMEPIDTTPDAFTFTGQTGVALSTVVTSNSITVTGINAPAPISMTTAAGSYSVSTDGGATWSAFSSSPGTVNANDMVRLRLTSPPTFLTTKNATLDIGGVSGTFSATTKSNIFPTASGTISQSGWTVTLVDNSTDDTALPSNAVRVHWGDGSPIEQGAAGSTFTHTYTVAGSYVIKHRVKDSGGLVTWSANQRVYVPVKNTVSGRVTRLDGMTPMSSVSLRLKIGGSVKKMTTTNASGNFTFTGVLPNSYTVEAVKAGYTFPTNNIPITVTNSGVTGINLTANK